jgi:hypothetical protein
MVNRPWGTPTMKGMMGELKVMKHAAAGASGIPASQRWCDKHVGEWRLEKCPARCATRLLVFGRMNECQKNWLNFM